MSTRNSEFLSKWPLPKFFKTFRLGQCATKADSGPARTLSPFEKIVKFDCKARIYFNYSQHVMFTICFYSLPTIEKHK